MVGFLLVGAHGLAARARLLRMICVGIWAVGPGPLGVAYDLGDRRAKNLTLSLRSYRENLNLCRLINYGWVTCGVGGARGGGGVGPGAPCGTVPRRRARPARPRA